LIVKRLGLTEHAAAYDAMRRFTQGRLPDTVDEIWITEHPPIYTVGVGGRSEHFPRGAEASIRDVPVTRIDRGGQITYHGPGQAIAYVLVDLARRALTVRSLVTKLEQAVIDLLGSYNVAASRTPGAPGVYVGDAKIAALGLRVRKGCCYHGLALNVDMDLTPFHAIDPCGYPGLKVTHVRALGVADDFHAVAGKLAEELQARLGEHP
jgi:lipoyl(octanoyl) transferase